MNIIKILFSMLMMLVTCSGLLAQRVEAGSASAEKLQIKESSFNFGKIQQGRPVTHPFEIINTGSDSLMIENVQASCGCTTPSWQKGLMAPGSSSMVTIGYNALDAGPFEKSVHVFYNGGQVKSIIIKGEVFKGPATSAPLNTSIALLKQINL